MKYFPCAYTAVIFMALKSKLPYRVVEKFPEGVNFAAEYQNN
ncbi:hypothetical protein [Bacteroides thetaiotaomicron]|jgi:hypothetical protein|nr:hypothetical protein [Bacteroides thetaiotaomicron]